MALRLRRGILSSYLSWPLAWLVLLRLELDIFLSDYICGGWLAGSSQRLYNFSKYAVHCYFVSRKKVVVEGGGGPDTVTTACG